MCNSEYLPLFNKIIFKDLEKHNLKSLARFHDPMQEGGQNQQFYKNTTVA